MKPAKRQSTDHTVGPGLACPSQPRIDAVGASRAILPGQARLQCFPSQPTILALVVIALVGFSTLSAKAQPGLPGVFLSRSFSGQFVVLTTPAAVRSPLASGLENDTNFVRLAPTLLPVSCERIKQLLWKELKTTSPWRGKIFLRLYPTGSADDPVTIESEQFRDGWQYRVSLPSLSQRERYVRAIVSVLLLEYANREARQRSAELPTWLVEGFTREILASKQLEIILPPPQTSDSGLRMTTLVMNTRDANPLANAHAQLCTGSPLNFQQLSWPAGQQFIGDQGELYRSSAQLFVHQLLNLPEGAACMRTMLEQLPLFYNWQFAFLHAFREIFPQTVDVEKWWSLQLVHFTGRELSERWTAEESWQKLDESIRSAIQFRVGTNEQPLEADVTLQAIIRDWAPTRQMAALDSKMRELQMLRPRLVSELGPLVDEYCQVIAAYIQNLNHPGFALPFGKYANSRRTVNQVLLRLDDLDARRVLLRPTSKPLLPIQADSRPAP